MKRKTLAVLLALSMLLGVLAGCGGAPSSSTPAASEPSAAGSAGSTPASAPEADPMADLIAAAQAEGELVVYGSCEEEYLAAACENFEALYGIKTTYQRLSTGEVQANIE